MIKMIMGNKIVKAFAVALLISVLAACIVVATDYIDPVCKMDVVVDNNTSSVLYNNTTYYFCSSMCKEEFEKEPLKFLNITDNTTAIDPVCKMTVDIASAQWNTTYDEKKYYFCSAMCKEEFEKNPDKFLK
jgi:P-type Cu+ transporter